MNGFRPVIYCKEKENARKQIKPQRMHITHAMSGEKVVRQFRWTNKKQGEGSEELGVPVQEFIEKIDNYMPERAAVIDCRLAALRAPMSVQLRSAILAIRKRRALRFSSAEKTPARWRLFDYRDRGVAQDRLGRFVRHSLTRLRRCVQNVYLECFPCVGRMNQKSRPKLGIDRVPSVMSRCAPNRDGSA